MFSTDCCKVAIHAAFALLWISNVCSASDSNLAELTIEQLMDIKVTSAAKKVESLNESPAAVAVLTSDDLRHLGATTVPEALRAVPGVNVARIDANKWAVSVRGFNDEFANKLLVMLDGRSIYTPSIGGVYWNEQDVVLEDVERIEVVRGPGGTLWGANAVNGVINIITKSAKDTQGFLASTIVGTENQPSISLRYGGKLSENLYYRVYGTGFNRDGFDDMNGRSLGDDWREGRGGFRTDWDASENDQITFLGDFFKGTYGEQVFKQSANPPAAGVAQVNIPTQGGDVLGRWTRTLSAESEFTFQVYYDRYEMSHGFGGATISPVSNVPAYLQSYNAMSEARDTVDVDFHHRFSPLDRHDVMWGAGYRCTSDRFGSDASNLRIVPDRETDHCFNAFLQDEIAVVRDRLNFTLGSKFEHNDIDGFQVQPGARLLWTPTKSQAVWASVSRAVRTPTRLERGLNANLSAVTLPNNTSILINDSGNPNLKPENLLAYEAGYRIEAMSGLSIDLAGFYNCYDDLILAKSSATRPGSFTYANVDGGDTWGAELLAQWQVTERWRLTGSYSWLRASLPRDDLQEPLNPRNQFHIASRFELSKAWTLDTAAYFVDRTRILASANVQTTTPAYLRFDVGLTWRPCERIEVGLWAQNLLDGGHVEYSSVKTPNVAEVPRTFFAKLTWRFQ